ncbi:hypothetical protein [Stenotrophomonas tuberculopleuritidis]|uniref:hypothetical protein n=1 Tax=Stenotrophomonas tuberculopleuritidis TaxID=3055079 RepID=UPI0026E50BE6|nr:hypothetical protein [Stenotrophomonas sp. 704A1]
MYNVLGVFMSYRRYYLWRARYRYYTRNMDRWTLVHATATLCLILLLWYHWRALSVPPPRVHPEAAALRVEGITNEAIHRIVLVRHGGTPRGVEFTTPADIRASTRRTLQVRRTLDSAVAWQLRANLLADIGDYIGATGGCAPYDCWQVKDRIALLRKASAENAAINSALEPILEMPPHLTPNLNGGERGRVKSGWSDSFNDIYYQTWLLGDLQRMHARMMVEYPKRAPAPWLPRLLTDPIKEPVIW